MNIAIFSGIIIGVVISMIFSSGFNTVFSLMHNQALKGFISLILFILSFVGLFCYLILAPHFTTSYDHNLWSLSFVITLICGIPSIMLAIK